MKIWSFVLSFLLASPLSAQVVTTGVTKAQVSTLIQRVEEGVDEFEKYLKRRGENARTTAAAAPKSSEGRSARKRRRGRSETPSAETTAARKSAADQGTEELKDALDDLDRSTNRLRRRFKKASNYMETKAQVDRVVDDGRDINQVMARGRYNSEVKRLWSVLRKGINDLARIYNITPLGV